MCVTFVYVCSSPQPGGYRLILLSNRDEYFARPALPLHMWKNNRSILGGMDITPGKEDGTWLAATKAGKIGVLLNLYGSPTSSQLRGRGALVPNYLVDGRCSQEFLESLEKDKHEYNPFHLVTVDLSDQSGILRHFSSKDGSITKFPDGCYAFGNSSLDAPFRKCITGQKLLSQTVEKLGNNSEDAIESLMEILKNESIHWPDPVLEASNSVRDEWKKYVSAINVRIPGVDYGTRTHTVITVDAENKVEIVESTLDSDVWKNTSLRFTISS